MFLIWFLQADLESQITEGRQLQNKLETEVAHYKAILAETVSSHYFFQWIFYDT